MDEVSLGRQATGQIVQLETDCLLHPGHAAIDRHPRRSTTIKVDRPLRLLVLPAVIIPRLQTVRTVKIQAPFVLPRNVGGKLSTIPELNVIIDLAVVNQCTFEMHRVE